MFCPMIKAECIGHKCSWFVDDRCAIFKIAIVADQLEFISAGIRAIDVKRE